MKVSKVNHVRAGVSNCNEIEGILYDYPGKDREKKDLSRQVTSVRNKARSLYCFFRITMPQKGCPHFDEAMTKFKCMKKMQDQFDSKEGAIRKALISDSFWQMNNEERRKKQENQLRELKFTRIETTAKVDNAAWDLVRKGLCQKMRKTFVVDNEKLYVPDVLVKMLIVIAEGKSLTNEVISEQEMTAFLRAFNDDYYMAATYHTIVPSIEEQNVRVQVKDGKLLPVYAWNNKKAGLFEFLKDYCASDTEEQKKMLKRVRALILLYVKGKETYIVADEEKSGVNESSFGGLVEDSIENFSEEAYSLSQEISQLDMKESSDKKKKRDMEARYTALLWDEIINHYKAAVGVSGLDTKDLFWLSYFEGCTKNLLIGKKSYTSQRLRVDYICNTLWKEFRSFVAVKYIDLGKAVYYFVMGGSELKKPKGTVSYGNVLNQYKEGFSSFDYERIKAQETFERSLSGYVSFATNNFARSVLTEAELAKGTDVLLNGWTGKNAEDRYRDILMYFGGKSRFEGSTLDISKVDELTNIIKNAIYSIRNGVFHFTATLHREEAASDLLKVLLHKDVEEAGKVIRKKYYSNNIPVYYQTTDIDRLIENLYEKEVLLPAQIPAFNSVLSRPKTREALNELKVNLSGVGDKPEEFQSAFYYVLKEIYYHDFLLQKDLLQRFKKAIDKIHEKENSRYQMQRNNGNNRKPNELSAVENFSDHMNELLHTNEDMSFGILCQFIMTEYNQQNNQMKKRPAAVAVRNDKGGETLKKLENDKEIYKHFRSLLYKGILNAFLEYLTQTGTYSFLKTPKQTEKKPESDFVKRKTVIRMYDTLEKSLCEEDADLLSWYVLSRFLNPAQVNHLAGSFKNYIQFLEDIERRAGATKNVQNDKTAQKLAEARKVLMVVEFTLPFCGQVTNTLTDYYRDEEDFANHINKFVDWGDCGKGATGLKAFGGKPICEQNKGKRSGGGMSFAQFFQNETDFGKVNNPFYDGMNPIVNRNAVLAMMYGLENILEKTMKSWQYEDLQDLEKLKNDLSEVFKRGGCVSEKEAEDLRLFQNHKNRQELVDVLILSELTNDLVSHLISWSTIRERDLMYFQLGFAYVLLNYSDNVAKESYLRKLHNDTMSIEDGALLYQIAAMYTYDLPVFGRDKNGLAKASEKNEMISQNVVRFCKEYCGAGEVMEDSVYYQGLSFFENIEEHDVIVKRRNYLDHFGYFFQTDMSLLDLYSEMYDRMLAYDLKLKKSVPIVLCNTLMKYFVSTTVSFNVKGEIQVNMPKNDKKPKVRVGSRIVIDKIDSDIFNCKLMEEKKEQKKAFSKEGKKSDEVMIKARTKEFIQDVNRLLSFRKVKR